jgi:PiT family inorganic phosphate transporter
VAQPGVEGGDPGRAFADYRRVGGAVGTSLAHGTNDARKTTGIITLALIAAGTLGPGAKAMWLLTLPAAGLVGTARSG